MLQRSWAVALCAALGLIVVVAGSASAIPSPSVAGQANAITSGQCAVRVNDTPSKLEECIQKADLWSHMRHFQAIADANPSPADGHASRNSGEPGYKASADYVAQVMKDAGYDVTIQTYKFTYYAYIAPPTFSENSPTAKSYLLGTDWNPGQSTGTANAARLQPAGGIIIPPTPTPSSSSGCTMADFS